MRSPRLAAGITLSLLALALAGYAAFEATVAGQSAAVAQLSQEVAGRAAEIGRLASARERLAALAGEERAIEAYFVPEASVVPLIDELESRGAALGATMHITSVAAIPAAKGGRPALSIALSIEGPFDAVVRTLGSIEYAPYAISTKGAALGKNENGEWKADVTLAVGAGGGNTSAPSRPSP